MDWVCSGKGGGAPRWTPPPPPPPLKQVPGVTPRAKERAKGMMMCPVLQSRTHAWPAQPPHAHTHVIRLPVAQHIHCIFPPALYQCNPSVSNRLWNSSTSLTHHVTAQPAPRGSSSPPTVTSRQGKARVCGSPRDVPLVPGCRNRTFSTPTPNTSTNETCVHQRLCGRGLLINGPR